MEEDNNNIVEKNPETQIVNQGNKEIPVTDSFTQVNNLKKPNLIMAIVMATVGGLIGCILWGILYNFNIIAGIASFVSVFWAGWLYSKFNLKMDKKGYFIVCGICLIELIFTIIFSLGITTAITLESNLVDALNFVFDLIKVDADFKFAFIKDVIVSVVFFILGIIYFISFQKRNNKK